MFSLPLAGLAGCEYADRRAADLAERDWGHNCVVTVAFVETMDRTIPAAVQVIQWVGPNRSTEPLRLEINRADGQQLDDGFTVAGAAALAAAPSKAAAMMGGAR